MNKNKLLILIAYLLYNSHHDVLWGLCPLTLQKKKIYDQNDNLILQAV